MGTTKLRKNGTSPKRVSDKWRKFIAEYLTDYNATRSAIAAGYSKKCADVTACRLLKNPLIAAEIGKQERVTQERYQATREDILEQLAYCATRTSGDFVDEKGRVLPLHKLGRRAQQAVDGIKQKVRRWVTSDGEEVEEVETELKLVPKGQAIEMAMKHHGLFAPEKHDNLVTLDWDSLHRSVKTLDADPVESLIAKEETARIEHDAT